MGFCGYPKLAGVEMRFTYFGQQVENTLYFTGNVDWGQSQLEDLGEWLEDWYKDELIAKVSDSLTLVSIICRDLGEADSLVIERSITSGNVGTLTSTGLPGNVTLAIKFNSGFAGRSKRGRNFLLGLVENRVTGNEVISPYLGEFVAAYEALNTHVVNANLAEHVIFSRKNCDPDTSAVGNVYPVTSYGSDGVIDSQRRRLTGRGS